MEKSNAFKYIFIIVIIILAIVTYSIYKKDAQTEENKIVVQETEENTNVVKELRLAISELDTINPIISHNKHVQEISKIIFDSLIELKEDYTKEYALAEEISKTNEITYIIKLKEGIKWSDGTELNSNDIKFTVQILKNINSIYTSNVQNIIAIDILDEQTLRFTLDKPVPFFEYNLTFPIMSSSYYKDVDFANSEKTNLPIRNRNVQNNFL